MIIARSTFKYNGQILIEKIKIQPPFRYEAIFQNSGCFLYFKERGPILLSSENNIQVNSKEAVLLKCGNHFLDLLKNTEDELIEVIVVHLFPEVLKKLYISELPIIIEQKNNAKQSSIIASSDVISKFIDSLEFYFQNPALVNNALLELKIKELVLLLLQSKNIDSVLELITSLYTPKIIQIKEVIQMHLFSNLTLEQLAKLCNLSLSSFKREFKTIFNDSPTNYINRKRLEKAQEFLKLSKLTISEIAYKTGFQDPLYFTRLFKKKLGSSPSEFRRNNII